MMNRNLQKSGAQLQKQEKKPFKISLLTYDKLVGESDGGVRLGQDEVEKLISLYHQSWTNRVVVAWINKKSGKECLRIKNENRCICGHFFKSHEWYDSEKRLCKCRCSGCSCERFNYLPSQGSWQAPCRCKHGPFDHFSMKKSVVSWKRKSLPVTTSSTSSEPRSSVEILPSNTSTVSTAMPKRRLASNNHLSCPSASLSCTSFSDGIDNSTVSYDHGATLNPVTVDNQNSEDLFVSGSKKSQIGYCTHEGCTCLTFSAAFSCRCGDPFDAHQTVIKTEEDLRRDGKATDREAVEQRLKQRNRMIKTRGMGVDSGEMKDVNSVGQGYGVFNRPSEMKNDIGDGQKHCVAKSVIGRNRHIGGLTKEIVADIGCGRCVGCKCKMPCRQNKKYTKDDFRKISQLF